MRVPPPGDADARTLEDLQQRISYDATERRRRYWAALNQHEGLTGSTRLDAIIRLADAEHAQIREQRNDDRNRIELVRDLLDVWATVDPAGIMSRQRAAETLREVLGE